MKPCFAYILCLFCFTAFLPVFAFSQPSIGQIETINYSRIQYAGGTQNWAMAQDANGRMYVANNEGLLVFDGAKWQLYPLPNKTILRSIAFGNDGKLYAGAQDEFGYYAADKVGRLHFFSLKTLLPDPYKTFADVWNIQIINNAIFFRTNDKIMRLLDNKITVYPPSSTWISMYKNGNQLLAQDANKGLFIFRDNQWQTLIEKSILPADFIITDILQYHNDTGLVCTTKKGLFLIAQNKLISFGESTELSSQHFTSLLAIDENIFFAGTYENGVFSINRKGKILENIISTKGLQNNTVRCLYKDVSGNVWIGLDNGISFIGLKTAIEHINPPSFNNGGGYGIKILNGAMYFALSTGLFSLPLSQTSNISEITHSPEKILDGQTWNLSVINNQILAGRDDGFWKINNQKPELISSISGYWTYQLISHNDSEKIAAGNYYGIRLFHEKNENLIEDGDIKNFTESSRFVEVDSNNIWISHPYRGVFKIDLSNYAVTKFSREDGLPSDLDNHVFKLQNKIVFATPKGIYEYNANINKIEPSKKYADLFGEMPIRYLKEDEKGNIWFVSDKMVGVADFNSAKPIIHFIPELKNKILSGFENIYPFNSQNVFIGAQSGFYHINYERYLQQMRPYKAYITLVEAIGNEDSIFFGGYKSLIDTQNIKTEFAYKWNSLHFSFAASIYGQQPVAEFSYYLKGFDKQWSNWSNKDEKEYTNLPEGTYTFYVKARNSPSQESEEYAYTFSIAPPWYRTWWAYAIYTIGLISILYAWYKFQEKKHRQKQNERRMLDIKKFEDEQRQLTFQHQLELEKSEKEVIRLQNENLQVEIGHKNSELAGIAMNLVQKKEFLLKITDELNKLNKSGKETIDAIEFKKILRSLTSEEKLDEEWKQFSIHFNKVHSNFLITLKNKHQNLNAHDLKLCAYLRMNLTTKEMARLMSISVRGVEINRYRLRKKLQLQPKEDIFQYLLKLESDNNDNGNL